MTNLSENALLGLALVLMLVALSLISAGAWNEIAWLWWAGLVVLAAGAVIPPATRFIDLGGGDDDRTDDRKD